VAETLTWLWQTFARYSAAKRWYKCASPTFYVPGNGITLILATLLAEGRRHINVSKGPQPRNFQTRKKQVSSLGTSERLFTTNYYCVHHRCNKYESSKTSKLRLRAFKKNTIKQQSKRNVAGFPSMAVQHSSYEHQTIGRDMNDASFENAGMRFRFVQGDWNVSKRDEQMTSTFVKTPDVINASPLHHITQTGLSPNIAKKTTKKLNFEKRTYK